MPSDHLFLRIILQKWGLPSDNSLESEAEETRAAFGLNATQKLRFRGSLTGAVAVANLATTYVAIVGGASALLYIAKAKPLFVYVILLLGLAIGPIVSSKLNQVSYLDIVEKPLETAEWRQNPFPRLLKHRIDVITAVIYGLNGALIVLAIGFYLGWLPTVALPKEEPPPVSRQGHLLIQHQQLVV